MEKLPSTPFSLLLLLVVMSLSVLQAKLLPSIEVNALNDIALLFRPQHLIRLYDPSACNISSDQNIGILCDCTTWTCHVIKLDLSSKKLNGSIPETLGNLSYLRDLDLSDNQFSGPIPGSVATLTSLEYLDLSYNFLSQTIPDSLGSLSNLTYTDLGYNYLEGSIPPTFGKLTLLRMLILQVNRLNGSIPDELGDISSLTYFDVGDNQLGGNLPSALGNLKNLTTLYLSENNFIGELPLSFGNLKSLKTFSAYGNNLNGSIPPFIGNWTRLGSLLLVGNHFEGPLPSEISKLKRLQVLLVSDLNGNKNFSLSLLSGLSELTLLVLRNCSVTGKIPEEIGTESLYNLDLSFNDLTGEIPKSLQNVTFLYLTRNNLSGRIPEWVSRSDAKYLDFSYNNFTTVPSQPTNKSYMNYFACCSHNESFEFSPLQIMNEQCPGKISKYSSLFINCGGEGANIEGKYYEQDNSTLPFYVSPNKNWAYSISGDFFTKSFSPQDYIRNSSCRDVLPDASLYTTARCSPLSLDYHGLCLHNGNYTVKLHFAEIVFTGHDDYSMLGTRVFDVYIQGIRVLKDFNIKEEEAKGKNVSAMEFNATVTDRHLEIHFYWAGKGSIYVPPGFYGPLISAISVTSGAKHGKKLSPASIAAIVISAIVILLVILAIIWKMGWRKQLPKYELQGSELIKNSITFQQLADATQNFSPANVIGKGGSATVYKAELKDGLVLAVKKLYQKSIQGTREFMSEVTFLTSLKHENLVQLWGWCLGDDQLLLIYEYMENNSLAHALFGTGSNLVCNWQTMYKICLGIAKGLAYLHGESEPKIIHRDIKASNVLLDRNLNAKISDFGLARAYDVENTQMTKIGGTHGYMAPEYAMRGILSEKIDVYSFGVVTLEIVSGKSNAVEHPNEETEFLLDKAYVLRKEGKLLNLVDGAVVDGPDYSEDQASMMLELAMMCTDQSPTLRPTMSEVVSILEGKKTIAEVSAAKQSISTNPRDNPSLSTGKPSTSKGGVVA